MTGIFSDDALSFWSPCISGLGSCASEFSELVKPVGAVANNVGGMSNFWCWGGRNFTGEDFHDCH